MMRVDNSDTTQVTIVEADNSGNLRTVGQGSIPTGSDDAATLQSAQQLAEEFNQRMQRMQDSAAEGE